MSTYRDHIESLNLEHFAYGEIVNRWALHRKMKPPRGMWRNISNTLLLADELRHRLGEPLSIRAAYRPVGGATDSQHRKNRAVDLDLPKRLRRPASIQFFKVKCARLMSEFGRELKIGMGFYRRVPWRVHIDTGYRLRDWHDNVVFDLIKEMGLKDPRRR